MQTIEWQNFDFTTGFAIWVCFVKLVLGCCTVYRGSPVSTNFGLPGNRTKRGLVLLERFFLGFKGKKPYYIGEFVLFSTILNRAIPGIVLSETLLSGDPQYISLSCPSITGPCLIFLPVFYKKKLSQRQYKTQGAQSSCHFIG